MSYQDVERYIRTIEKIKTIGRRMLLMGLPVWIIGMIVFGYGLANDLGNENLNFAGTILFIVGFGCFDLGGTIWVGAGVFGWAFKRTSRYKESIRDAAPEEKQVSSTVADQKIPAKTKAPSVNAAAPETRKIPTEDMEISLSSEEDDMYRQIWEEIEAGNTDVGLWAKCFSICEGDENKTKALYVKKRLIVYKEALEIKQKEQEKAHQERKAREEQKKLAAEEKAKKLSVLKGRTDSLEIFKKALAAEKSFFEDILKKFGYSLVTDKRVKHLFNQDKWEIHRPDTTAVRYVYNLSDLRKIIREIVEKHS